MDLAGPYPAVAAWHDKIGLSTLVGFPIEEAALKLLFLAIRHSGNREWLIPNRLISRNRHTSP